MSADDIGRGSPRTAEETGRRGAGRRTKQGETGKGGWTMKKGYAGSISNSGAQVVKAPMPPQSTKGKSTVKTGSDLRSGK